MDLLIRKWAAANQFSKIQTKQKWISIELRNYKQSTSGVGGHCIRWNQIKTLIADKNSTARVLRMYMQRSERYVLYCFTQKMTFRKTAICPRFQARASIIANTLAQKQKAPKQTTNIQVKRKTSKKFDTPHDNGTTKHKMTPWTLFWTVTEHFYIQLS